MGTALLFADEAEVEVFGDLLLVEVLSDEDELLHTVAVFRVPVLHEVRILGGDFLEVFLRGGGVPFAGGLELELTACLLEEVGHVGVVAEVAETLGADDAARPLLRYEIVELVHVEGRAAAIDEGSDAVFLNLAALMLMMMVVMMPSDFLVVTVMVFILVMVFVIVMVMSMFVLVVVFVIVMMVLMLVVVMVFVIVVMMVSVLIIVVVVVIVVMVSVFVIVVAFLMVMLGLAGVLLGGLDALDPAGGGRHLVVVEQTGVQQLVELDVSVVALDDFGLRLKLADDGLYAFEFLRRHFRRLVEEDCVAELNLLNYKIFDVFLVDVLHHEGVAAVELALHSHRIDHRHDVVEPADAVLRVETAEGRDAADCPRDGLRLADSAGLDDDVVELLHPHDFINLLDEIRLERAADAAVLERDETLVLLSDHSAFLDEVRVYVHFPYVIDNHGEAYALFICQNPVEERRLAASEIAGEQEHRNFFLFHIFRFTLS